MLPISIHMLPISIHMLPISGVARVKTHTHTHTHALAYIHTCIMHTHKHANVAILRSGLSLFCRCLSLRCHGENKCMAHISSQHAYTCKWGSPWLHTYIHTYTNTYIHTHACMHAYLCLRRRIKMYGKHIFRHSYMQKGAVLDSGREYIHTYIPSIT